MTSFQKIPDGTLSGIGLKHYLAGAMAVAFGVFYYLAQSWGQELLVVSSDLLFIVASGTCSLLGLLVARRWGLKGRFGVVHFGFFLGVFAWFLGETAWGVYEIFLHVEVPYPSLADVFYLTGYVPAATGMLWFIWFFRRGLTPRKLTAGVLLGSIVVVASGVFLLYPLLTESADLLTETLDVAYPSLDVLLLVFAVMMALVFEHGRFASSWLWIALGMFLTAVGDIAFSYGTLTGWYYSGHPTELFYLWGYLSLGLGFDSQKRLGARND